jgi:diguanylate cyclase (GGDEF)-like protein
MQPEVAVDEALMADDLGRHFSNSLVRMLLEVTEQQLGAEGVAAVLREAGEQRPRAELVDDAGWSSYDQFVALLSVASEAMGGIESLERIYRDVALVGSTGSTAEMVAIVQQLGSPIQLIRSMGVSNQFTMMDIVNTELHESAYQSCFRTTNGFELTPELSAYMRGLIPLGVRVFGFDDIVVEPATCEEHGEGWCTVRVSWDDTRDDEFLLEEARLYRHVAEQRLATFQETVAEVVSADDLDTVLDRVVNAASRATTSSAHILEVDGLPGRTRYYSRGIPVAEAPAIVAQADVPGSAFISVEVASATRHFGRLVVADFGGGARFERPALESYARLAATALESAVALESARRQAATSAALLELSAALTELGTGLEVASKLVAAMPAVIDCDASAIVLINDEILGVAAQQGFDEATLGLFEWSAEYVEAFGLDSFRILVQEELPEEAKAAVSGHTFAAFATAPISIDDTVVGILIVAVQDAPERLVDDVYLEQRFSGLAALGAIALRNAWLVDQIRHQSLHDHLTDLPNRALILDRAEQMIARSERNREPCAAFFIDLDGFKSINDTQGHESGDHLLRAVADRLRAVVRESDTVGRLGGDEFVVLADGASLDAGVGVVAERLLDILREPFILPGVKHPVAVRASIGIALGDGHTASELLHDADVALYSAKAAGRACYRIFATELQHAVRERVEFGEALSRAVTGNEFFLVYQPIFDLRTERVKGVEALLRWKRPTGEVVAPSTFVAHLEESCLIVEVGRTVLRDACRQTARWHAEGHVIDVSVNVSMRQLERHAFVDEVRAALLESGLDPASLIVEITETAIMLDADTTMHVLRDLRALGVRVAIDDFGTGYSSLAYLRQFPVDALKIDRSFIHGVMESAAAVELIRTLVQLGKALDLETFAEGIEHREQLSCLREEGCDNGQGFMFARPLTADAVTTFLVEHRRLAGAVEI